MRDRVKGHIAADEDASTTVLGNWFATALFWRPQVALLVDQRKFVPVFMPLAPVATLLDRAPGYERQPAHAPPHHLRPLTTVTVTAPSPASSNS